MSIFVTGGIGFIGSHTVVKLIEDKQDVIIIDNLSNAKIDIVDKIEKITEVYPKFYEGDIRDEELLDKIFQENEIECVIHFAGLKAVGESVKIPIEYYDNNVAGTVTLLKVMQKNNCRNMVFSSSATVYGVSNPAPFHEDMPLSTINPYGATKLMIEDMLRDVARSDATFSIALLRYFNPIGAHESGLIGENPNGIPNNLLPYIAKVATKEIKELQVFGDDYDTIDGTGVRDYIHVEDLARGHLHAMKYVLTHKGIEPFNLGTGTGNSVLQVVKAYEKASQREIAYQVVERREGDIPSCYADTTKAKELLGWEAMYNLQKMCEDGWRFAKNNMEK